MSKAVKIEDKCWTCKYRYIYTGFGKPNVLCDYRDHTEELRTVADGKKRLKKGYCDKYEEMKGNRQGKWKMEKLYSSDKKRYED